jgi:hypothetical protein
MWRIFNAELGEGMSEQQPDIEQDLDKQPTTAPLISSMGDDLNGEKNEEGVEGQEEEEDIAAPKKTGQFIEPPVSPECRVLHMTTNSPRPGAKRKTTNTTTGCWVHIHWLKNHLKLEEGFTHVCGYKNCGQLLQVTKNHKSNQWLTTVCVRHFGAKHPET